MHVRRALPLLAVSVLSCSGESKPPPDTSAVLACRDFMQARADDANGTLAQGEWRTRMEAVHERAQRSEDPRVRDPARVLLAAANRGLPAEEGLVDELRAACEPHLAK